MKRGGLFWRELDTRLLNIQATLRISTDMAGSFNGPEKTNEEEDEYISTEEVKGCNITTSV